MSGSRQPYFNAAAWYDWLLRIYTTRLGPCYAVGAYVVTTRTNSLTLLLTLYRYNRRHDEADVSAATMATAFGHNDIKEAEH